MLDDNKLSYESGHYGFYLLPLTKNSDTDDAVLINILDDQRITDDVLKYLTNLGNVVSYNFQTEIEAINAIDENSAYFIASTHISDVLFLNSIYKQKYDLNVLYKVSW